MYGGDRLLFRNVSSKVDINNMELNPGWNITHTEVEAIIRVIPSEGGGQDLKISNVMHSFCMEKLYKIHKQYRWHCSSE